MGNFIVFESPVIAQELRDAGLVVFKQRYNGRECFATENTPEMFNIMAEMKHRFGVDHFAISRTLVF